MNEYPEQRFSWNLDWNLLRTFVVIVEQRGITAAAAHMGRKQPTVSNSLARLEHQFGQRLIERKPNFFKVTPAGERLYQECVDIFGTVSRLPNVVGERAGEVTGHVSIGVASHVTCPLFDRVLGDFHRRHPKVTFSLAVSESRQVISQLLQKRIGLGVCLAAKRDDRLDYDLLYRQFFGFFCGPNHRLFGRAGLPMSALEAEPVVSFQTDHEDGALRAVARLRSAAGMTDTLTGVSSSLQEVRRMIVCGMGIGPLPLHVAQRDVDDGLLWQLPPYDDLPRIDIFVVSNPRARKNRAEEAFFQSLRDAIAATPITDRTYALLDGTTSPPGTPS